eukprot:CAMPEP_0116987746 /NCGR_PEP_ID=MMETSP0467-20121206/63698_1 /TAXON_ID=283647 /ORGANISM="Mesodinium pulex, Strain SPMC105" /LENGTH=40 /DNA_ID= /DNA_START= /DNA_END= /DNA_ORIENTATION=
MEAVCRKHEVRSIPTLVYIKGGEERGRMEGVDHAELKAWA